MAGVNAAVSPGIKILFVVPTPPPGGGGVVAIVPPVQYLTIDLAAGANTELGISLFHCLST
jgi:hypothetical protein